MDKTIVITRDNLLKSTWKLMDIICNDVEKAYPMQRYNVDIICYSENIISQDLYVNYKLVFPEQHEWGF